MLLLACWARPPELIRVGANYSAKIVCSNVFLANRDPQAVLYVDVQATGHPLLRLMRVSVDRAAGVVRAGLLGFIGGGLAVSRPGMGCTVVPDGDLATALAATAAAPAAAPGPAAGARPFAADRPGPQGEFVAIVPALAPILTDARLAGPGVRAIVVLHQGRIIAERYAEGFDARTPLLGWSMTKTVMAGLIGILVKDGLLSIDQPAGWPAADPRGRIRIADLLGMSSGLRFNEAYGAVSDVTRMLFLEPDMAAFARSQPLAHPPGTVWSYSSGTAVILSRIFMDAAGPRPLGFVRERLFDPLGMSSAVIETDEHGTLVGSSYMYANARDWARYGQLLLQDGVWRGDEILPRGYVAMMTTPVAASGGQYGHGQVWLAGPDGKSSGIPADTIWLQGHDGQSIAVIPSRRIVVVRLGLTPERTGYRPEPLVHALLDAVNRLDPGK